MEIIKRFWWILLIGFLVRLIIAGISFHPDVRILNYTSAIILREQNLDPYSYVHSLPQDSSKRAIYGLETPDDLPLQYWINLPVDLLLRPLINTTIEDQFLENTSSLFGNFALYLHLIYLKLPLLLFDLLLGVVLSMVVRENLRKKVLILWMLNPFTLWATAAIGQVDIIPTFFVVLSLLFVKKNKLGWAALALGVGGALKSYPFLLFPFLVFLAGNWKERLKLCLLVILPLVVTILPYLPSPAFRTNALFAPQLDKIFYAKILLSGGEAVYINVCVVTFLYLIYFLKKRTVAEFTKFSTILLLLVLSFTHFHIQWFLWVTPFLVINLVEETTAIRKFAIILLCLSVVVMLFLFEPSLQMSLFAPLFPHLENAKGLAEILGHDKAGFFRDSAASVFAALSVFLAII